MSERAHGQAAAPPLLPTARPHGLALLLLAALGALFFTSYMWSNWLTSQRADIPSVYFEWERHIPFVPWTILPYWSIDFLYAGSFFLWSTRSALLTHAKRLLAAQLISVACFIAFPLRFAFVHPVAGGWAGDLFALLGGFDKPFNQAPSLHISLLFILWVAYSAHIRSGWRWLLHGWFTLIGLSVLTTYQHHVIDVPTGWLVGCLCVFAVSPSEKKAAVAADAHTARIARLFGAGAVAIALLSLAALDGAIVVGMLLAWMALSLACVAHIYYTGSAVRFGKNADGTLPVASWCVLAPYVCGAFLNALWWTRHQAAASQLTSQLWIGRFPSAADLCHTRADAVLDLTAELPRLARVKAYRCVPVLDLTIPSQDELRAAVHAIDAWQAKGYTVLICCALGFSRSALVAGACLSDQCPALDQPSQVLAKLRAARPGVVLGPRGIAALATYMSTKRAPTPIGVDRICHDQC